MILRIRDKKLEDQITAGAKHRRVKPGRFCKQVLQAWFAHQKELEIQAERRSEIEEKTRMVNSEKD